MNVRLLLAAASVAGLTTACGGASPTQPTVPTPTLAPAGATTAPAVVTPASPAPQPSPSPTAPPCTQGLCEAPTTNTNPPVRLTLRLYKIVGPDGRTLTGVTNDTVIPVGGEATIDATAKDENGNDTLGTADVEFFVQDNGNVSVSGNHSFQRKLKVTSTGTAEVSAVLDGVYSNTLQLKLGTD